MKNRFKIWIIWIALMVGFVGAVPVSGQMPLVQTLEDGSTIFPVFGNNLVQLDSCGRLEGVLNSQGGLTTFAFDNEGNLSRRTAADLKVTDYGYDALNRMVAVTNDGVEVATFDHDNNGNTLLASDSDTSVSFGYDEMNRLTASTQTVDSGKGSARTLRHPPFNRSLPRGRNAAKLLKHLPGFPFSISQILIFFIYSIATVPLHITRE